METQSSGIKKEYGLLSLPVIVAALGYFVDIYDLTVFSVLRVPSLKGLGLDDAAISTIGTRILNLQLTGLIVGGIAWGVIGDKIGRRTVLFGSIILYSLTNIGCAFVTDTNSYGVLRFLAGIGLAGELGAGITLVAEMLPIHKRSYATSIVTGFGLLGAAVAFFTYELLDWRNTFLVGGILGIALLLLRFKVFESGMFERVKQKREIRRGNFLALIFNRKKLLRFLGLIGVATPIYYFFGFYAAFSNELGQALSLSKEISPGKCIMIYYLGLAVGDLVSGPLSQLLHSRRRVIGIMLCLSMICCIIMLSGIIQTTTAYYTMCWLGGFTTGYWAMFVLMVSESFGTNLRSSATTSAPNFVRGSLILMTLLYQALKPSSGILQGVIILGILTFTLASISWFSIKETHGSELDFEE